MTSHAAVVPAAWAPAACPAAATSSWTEANKQFTLGGKTYKEGDWISLDGSTGNIYGERLHTAEAQISGEFGRIMAWADKYRDLQVRTNADTPKDARQAKNFGAEGIGLCRTEHMFFEADRIAAIREMIVSETTEQRERALAKLEPIQQKDFEEIYEAMMGKPSPSASSTRLSTSSCPPRTTTSRPWPRRWTSARSGCVRSSPASTSSTP